MGEVEYSPSEADMKEDGFGLTKERRLKTVGTNMDLILRRCKRKEIQPREMLLRAFRAREEINERLGSQLVEEMRATITGLPDYDLSNRAALAQARQDMQHIFSKIVDFEYSGSDQSGSLSWQEQASQNWQQAGMFSYEYGENNELILHIPPMAEAPQLSQMKESLHQLAHILEQEPDIQEVRGSSLLLEHPIAKRLGFMVDAESDEGFNPNFRMSRKEFLDRFGE